MSQPKKKRQHYVPKFYLRHFSFDDGSRLHLIHTRKLREITGISLKEQCYDDYFYGKDPRVENALQDMEGVTAEVFRTIIANQRLPQRGTPDEFILRTFICLQWGRTKSHAETSEAMFNKMLKTAYGSTWRANGNDVATPVRSDKSKSETLRHLRFSTNTNPRLNQGEASAASSITIWPIPRSRQKGRSVVCYF